MTNDPRPESTLSRRHVLRSALAAGGAWAAMSSFSAPGLRAEEEDSKALPDGATILFQGDSITDAGRRRESTGPNDAAGMGRGYPFLIASYLLGGHPKSDLRCFNRGISGHRVPDLANRWEKDTIEIAPHVLSILIGVNDIWHRLNGNYDGTPATYETGFKELLERTREKLPHTKLVICEPFVLRCGAVNDRWFPEFDERRAAAKRVAEGAGATWVPFQSMFDEAVKDAKPEYWAGDGVHPSMAGHALMARTWLQHVL